MFKTVLRGLWTFGFVELKIVFWVLFVELVGLLTSFSFQALFSYVLPREDPSRFSFVAVPKSLAHVLPSCLLPMPSASLHPGTQPFSG